MPTFSSAIVGPDEMLNALPYLSASPPDSNPHTLAKVIARLWPTRDALYGWVKSVPGTDGTFIRLEGRSGLQVATSVARAILEGGHGQLEMIRALRCSLLTHMRRDGDDRLSALRARADLARLVALDAIAMATEAEEARICHEDEDGDKRSRLLTCPETLHQLGVMASNYAGPDLRVVSLTPEQQECFDGIGESFARLATE